MSIESKIARWRATQHNAKTSPDFCGERTDAGSSLRDPFKGGGNLETKGFDGSGSPYLRQIFLNLGGEKEMRRPFIQSPWVNACIRAIARQISAIPLVFRSGFDLDSAPLPDTDPIVRLFRKPNPLTTGRKWMQRVAIMHELFGEHFDFMLAQGTGVTVNADGTIAIPEELWSVRSDIVEMELDKATQLPALWKFQADRRVVKFAAPSVWHAYEVDPYNVYRGVGPMQAAFRTATKEYDLERFDDALLRNGGQPSGAYSIEGGDPTPEQMRELRRQHEENVGNPEQHMKPMVLAPGVNYKPIAHSPREMDLADLRKHDLQIIMAIFGVTKPILGITEDVNRANAREAKRVFIEDTIIPKLEAIEDDLNNNLLARLQRRGSDQPAWAHFDLSNVEALRESNDEKTKALIALFKDAGRSFNEAASIAGVDVPADLAGGDDRFIPATLIPAPLAEDVARARATSAKPAPGGKSAASGDQLAVGEGASEGEGACADASARINAELEAVRLFEAGDPEPDLTEKQQLWLKEFTREERMVYVDKFDKALIPHDRRVARIVKSHLSKYMAEMTKRLEAKAKGRKQVIDLASSPDTYEEFIDIATKRTHADIERQLDALLTRGVAAFEKAFQDAIQPAFNKVWDAAAKRLAEELGFTAFVGHETPEALAFIRDKTIKLAERTLGTLELEVRRTVLSTFVEGQGTVGTLSRRLEATLSKWKPKLSAKAGTIPTRANRIARTETTSMANGSRLAEMKKDEVGKHLWITSRDAFVRPHHSDLDGRVRKVGAVFGFSLRHPGDPQAKAGDVINCRCTTAPAP